MSEGMIQYGYYHDACGGWMLYSSDSHSGTEEYRAFKSERTLRAWARSEWDVTRWSEGPHHTAEVFYGLETL